MNSKVPFIGKAVGTVIALREEETRGVVTGETVKAASRQTFRTASQSQGEAMAKRVAIGTAPIHSKT